MDPAILWAPPEIDHVNLRVIAGALVARDDEVRRVGGHVHVEHHLGRIRPVMNQPVGRLRIADTVKPDLAEILFVFRRHRSRLRVSRVEKAVVPPGDRRKLHPLQAIRARSSRRHIVDQQLLRVAAVARQAIDDEIARVVRFEHGDRGRASLVEPIGIDEYISPKP